MPQHRENSLSHLGFQRFTPSIKLARFVDCYWFINTPVSTSINYREYLHPNGGVGIILNYGDPLQFDKTLHTDSCILDGTNTVTRELGLTGIIKTVGIRFKTAGACLFFLQPLSELKNETVSLADTQLKDYPYLYHELDRAKTYGAKVSIIEHWLYRCIQSEKRVSDVVTASITLINKNRGLLPIRTIAATLDYNQRKIERLFRAQVGMSPKEYSCTLRIEKARSYINRSQQMSFSEIAYQLGFYDQAHFINQFKRVVGITPREYLIKKLVNTC
jgi:AraC-like DNA-binding protein